MPIVFGVALGGALGASARYGVDRLIEQRTSSVFPWATFTINVTGCFVIGAAHRGDRRAAAPAGVGSRRTRRRRGRRLHDVLDVRAGDVRARRGAPARRSRSRTSLRASSSASPRSTPAPSRAARSSCQIGTWFEPGPDLGSRDDKACRSGIHAPRRTLLLKKSGPGSNQVPNLGASRRRATTSLGTRARRSRSRTAPPPSCATRCGGSTRPG